MTQHSTYRQIRDLEKDAAFAHRLLDSVKGSDARKARIDDYLQGDDRYGTSMEEVYLAFISLRWLHKRWDRIVDVARRHPNILQLAPHILQQNINARQRNATIHMFNAGASFARILDVVAFHPSDNSKVKKWVKDLVPVGYVEACSDVAIDAQAMMLEDPEAYDAICAIVYPKVPPCLQDDDLSAVFDMGARHEV